MKIKNILTAFENFALEVKKTVCGLHKIYKLDIWQWNE